MTSTAKHPTIERPLQTLRVEVVHGVDVGLTHVSDEVHESLSIGTATDNSLVLQDRAVSRYHLELSNAAGGALAVDHGSTNGTWVGSTRLERGVVAPGTVLRMGDTHVRVGPGPTAKETLHAAPGLGDDIVGGSVPMRKLYAQIERAARSDAATLVVGESGTGKELVARAVHDLSPRHGQPFVIVDCGAIAPTLIASELFGHERGAFTGADRTHIGAIERAHRGTIFFDEIGELPLTLQASLLGVLQRMRIRRLGGREDIAVDVRVVSATNRDLRAEVNASSFRLDLFYRLAVVTLRVPALRERREDIPALIESFLRKEGHTGSLDELFSPETVAQLAAQHWNGNVRELRNVIESTLAMGELPPIENAPPGGVSTATSADEGGLVPYRHARDRILNEFEASYLAKLVAQTKNNVSLAAREAKMDRSHLISLLKKHGIR